MRGSRLPDAGQNLFQAIKAKCAEATARGKTLYKLSIGQPAGPALLSARKAAAEAVMSDKESMHEYQDNGSPGVRDFSRRFVQEHFGQFPDDGLRYLPIPGIKPMLGLVQLACRPNGAQIKVGYTTRPGYPTPEVWGRFLQVEQYFPPLNPGNFFRFHSEDIDPDSDLLMVNYPHNPSGQIATEGWWREICGFCARNDIRLFNDNPYYILSHSLQSYPLAKAAWDFPELSWAEAFSASKVISNGTGWRIGAMVGSSDFIADIATIKGDTDSGFAAPMAAGALASIVDDRKSVEACGATYKRRIEILSDILQEHGMKLALYPKAGFFTLWHRPTRAFGRKVRSAEEFNYLMIEETGVVGVHFEPYIRYAVTGDIQAMAPAIDEAFKKAKVSYD